jgi:putative nucleotidyltransferase with HDIG domain
MPRSSQLFLASVISAGTAAIAYSTMSLIRQPVDWEWLVLAGLIVITASFSIKIPSVSARLSVSEAFIFAAVLLFGAHVGTIVVALDSLVLTTWLRKAARSPLRTVFNITAGALAISVATRVLERMLPLTPAADAPLEQLLGPVFVLALSYFVINSSLIATAVAFEQHTSPIAIWRRNFSWVALNYLGGASVALVLVSYTTDINLAAVGVIVPLLIVLYLTFRTSWGRVEDAHRHVAQVNDLYMSTIEALAMAVDAKDQITHGHIRRVQVFAVELAKRLGVSEERQLKAIATAALLHDMGKLAIPEHILNKPGKLTPIEFDKMKRHAQLGADLLSSVKFPYPVVPIVRHHHEHWDGSGYPTGISGTDIPLGARLLSVVDCFDALTSDRPYRPRLSTTEAFHIIHNGRGTLYDPLVVDTFISAYADIAPVAIRAGEEARRFMNVSSELIDSAPVASLRQIRASVSDAALLDRCSQELVHATSSRAALNVAALCLRQLTPATVYALFLHDKSTDVLKCVATVGDSQTLLDGLTIPLGERISGWAAANRQTSVNSDATLDLMHIARLFVPPLRTAISAPLTDGYRTVGVLTTYSPQEEAFHEGHRYALERVAAALAGVVSADQGSGAQNVVPFQKWTQ